MLKVKSNVFNIFCKASRCKGNTKNNFVSLLEKKLSAILYRSGQAPTMPIIGIIVEVPVL
jgi:ribosomal protein S4